MKSFFYSYRACALVAAVVGMISFSALAGGITVGGTRIVYPAEAKQTDISVSNSSTRSSFLVQSWVDDAQGVKVPDFIVTPPLYVSAPGNENILRIMYTGAPLPSDRESLFYFNAKAIPSVDKSQTTNKNVLKFAAITRIKLFVRPQGLSPSVSEAPEHLSFRRQGGHVVISNPTPYYLTLIGLRSGKAVLHDVMVPPRGAAEDPLPAGSAATVTYHTLNDYGATTAERRATIAL
ncbi:fimbria/pilus periplasmic chaperone [Salmonella enterica]|nr:fimbria/pilus periplasmic chaperone [Salmonella enterica]